MPQTYLRSLDPGQVAKRATLVRHHFNVGRRIWSLIGDGKVGAVLLDRFWSGDDPWVTTDYVTAELEGAYSDDTVRRRLKELTSKDVILKRREGRLTLYAIRPSIAEEIASLIESGPETADCGQKTGDNRNLRENLIVVGPYQTHRDPDTA